MAFSIPWTEPTSIQAGDRVRWKRSLSAYPATAESWTLKYFLIGNFSGGDITITASADGENHEVDVAAATTAAWTAGKYAWKAFVDDGTSRHFIAEGDLEIFADFEEAAESTDTRTFAEKMVDLLETALQNRADRPEASYSLSAAGRSFTYKSDQELREAWDFWKGRVLEEQEQRRILQGKASGNQVKVRFTRS